LNCAVCSFNGEEAYLTMKQEAVTAFNEGDYAAIIRLMDTHFGMHNYTLKDLFRDEQRHILRLIINGTLQEFEDKLITLYENSKSLMGFIRESGMPVPHHFMTTAETALNLKLRKMFFSETIDIGRLTEDINEIRSWNIAIDNVAFEFIIRRSLEGKMAALLEEPENAQRLTEVLLLVETIASLPVVVNFWQIQNMYWTMLQSQASELRLSDHDSDGRSSERALKLASAFFNVLLTAAKGEIRNGKCLRIPVSTTASVQFTFPLQRCQGHRSLSVQPRYQRYLCITVLQGVRGQPSRL
jgi:hypothetical protein